MTLKTKTVATIKANVAMILRIADWEPSGYNLKMGSCRAQRLINVRVEAENPLAHPI